MVLERGGLTRIRNENRTLANIIYGQVTPVKLGRDANWVRVTTIVMSESQYPPEPGELEQLLAVPDVRCPPPNLTDFEEYGVDPCLRPSCVGSHINYGHSRVEQLQTLNLSVVNTRGTFSTCLYQRKLTHSRGM